MLVQVFLNSSETYLSDLSIAPVMAQSNLLSLLLHPHGKVTSLPFYTRISSDRFLFSFYSSLFTFPTLISLSQGFHLCFPDLKAWRALGRRRCGHEHWGHTTCPCTSPRACGLYLHRFSPQSQQTMVPSKADERACCVGCCTRRGQTQQVGLGSRAGLGCWVPWTGQGPGL